MFLSLVQDDSAYDANPAFCLAGLGLALIVRQYRLVGNAPCQTDGKSAQQADGPDSRLFLLFG
jgi:hypothetical protein